MRRVGVVLAALLAWAWSRYGQRVNLRRFFQVTSIFLVLFTIQLFVYAFHEFTEAGVMPGIDNEYWHLATEPYGPEGPYGEWLTYLMVLIPVGWLALSWWQDRTRRHEARLWSPSAGCRLKGTSRRSMYMSASATPSPTTRFAAP